ncbi:translation initiation factor IF-2 [Buchnera aphidicola (Hyadaphis tataricae)]|uniref:Translation initiation factor IF-2 n=1 Tax=Buchnera aphidicola (Hyadaphis tataricae) TaxID=1241859 RepID=A0A4D6Y6W9_9GAMM|nr:translation initiation factor IF-2 [Buchnera aphidicola]QCI21670.1 translation initiation factor IF-2 [Buchnera aphidicola (Hyadaphis tataricae)]
MTDISIKFLSKEIKIPVQELIQELLEINIIKSENDCISSIEKDALLKRLEYKKKLSLKTLIVQRKTRSTLNVPTLGGRNKSITIEVRKKRTYIKNNKFDNDLLSKNSKKNNKLFKNDVVLKKQENKNFEQSIKMSTIETIYKQHKNVVDLKKIHESQYFKNVNQEENNKKVKIDTKNIRINTKNKIKEKNLDSHKKIIKNHHLKMFLNHNVSDDNSIQKIEKDKRNHNRVIKKNRYQKINKNALHEKKYRENKHIINRNKLKNKNHPVILQQAFKKPEFIINRDVLISSAISVSELANKMAIKSSELIKKMMNIGIVGNINYVLDQDTAQLIAEEMGHKVILHKENALEEMIMKDRDKGNNISIIRAPVVTIMGHVDHGKTSLLDYIRATQVAAYEAGGITQNIGAYHVKTNVGSITFLDTPGHSAFTAMRSRGVQITDIVILVVAADDGVMPQTIEAIQHAKEANVPVIIAINKIDKTDSDISKIKNDLMKYNILSEEWGGDNIFVPVSAKTGEGINELLNAILLQSEILELKAVSTGMAEGVVIESSLDKGRGPVSTVLVTKGNLKKGDIVLCGCEYGRVKALRNEIGKEVLTAGPSIPVEILGLSKVSFSGDKITVVRSEKKAKEVASYRKEKSRAIKLSERNKTNLENMFENINKNDFSELKIILKSDVQGSLEAISSALLKLSTKEVKLNIISLGIGGITETDASLALASDAIILGFNVRADSLAKKIITAENLDLRYYSVIYDLIDEVKSAMTGLLSPKYKQNILGLAEVRNIFKSPKFGLIAGCMVLEGIIKKSNPIHILRNNIVVYEGVLESLRRFKEDVNEIRSGLECGIGVKNYNDIHVKDIIEVFEITEIKRKL